MAKQKGPKWSHGMVLMTLARLRDRLKRVATMPEAEVTAELQGIKQLAEAAKSGTLEQKRKLLEDWEWRHAHEVFPGGEL